MARRRREGATQSSRAAQPASPSINFPALALISFLLLLSALLFFSRLPVSPNSTMMESRQYVFISVPDNSVIWAERVSSDEGITAGLSGRESLCAQCGMLFVFRDSAMRAFWMKGMKFPLDIMFMDEDCRVVKIAASVPPCEGACVVSYGSGVPAKYVLEASAGYAAEHNISEGAQVCFAK